MSGSPVAPGDTYDINTCVLGQPGDEICFHISVHSENIEVCCSKECCIILPPCEGAAPDECEVTRLVPCCPTFPGGPSFGNAILTI
ncbi:MAG: hypothetical protein GWO24_30955, partial [Akkermansiaceae bacterium]|nr:hypothetical protein [Akkermansiaceae bacterium]